MKKRVYIAGPMTGYNNHNRAEFFSIAADLQDLGYIVLNPATLPEGLKQSEYMDICLAMIRAASAIYMLKGYESSKGALTELAYAEKLELEIIKQ